MTLWDMTPREFKATGALETDSSYHRRISAQAAHKHVRAGGVHNTALWIDCDNRIRRATG
jgi:hypothetical protein